MLALSEGALATSLNTAKPQSHMLPDIFFFKLNHSDINPTFKILQDKSVFDKSSVIVSVVYKLNLMMLSFMHEL